MSLYIFMSILRWCWDGGPGAPYWVQVAFGPPAIIPWQCRVQQLKVTRIHHFYKGYHGNGLRLVPSGKRVPGLMSCQLLIKNCHFSFLSYGPFALFLATLPKHISHVKVFIETARSFCFHSLLSNIASPLHIADMNNPGFQFLPEQRALYCQAEKTFLNQSISFEIKATVLGMLSSLFCFLPALILGSHTLSPSHSGIFSHNIYAPHCTLHFLYSYYLIYIENIISGLHYVDDKFYTS